MNITETLQRATTLHSQGEIAQAEALYRAILGADEECGFAHANLGAALVDMQRPGEALDHLERAIAIDPSNAIALNNRAAALLQLGRPNEALHECEHALGFQPQYASAYSNQSSALLALGRPQEALASADRALLLQPDLAVALNNRGSALVELGRSEEALGAFNRALALQPDWPLALTNRASALLHLRRPEQALRDIELVLGLQPPDAPTLNNHGNALRALQRFEEALASYERAIALQPGFAVAHYNLGNALLDVNRPEAALASFEEAIRLHPTLAEGHYGRGTALLQQQRFADAGQAFLRAGELRSALPYAWGLAAHSLMQCTDWAHYGELQERLAQAMRTGGCADEPASYLGMSSSAASQLQCARKYLSDRFPAQLPFARPVRHYDHARIRVGYLSADLRDHAVSYLMAGVFERHDREHFETIALSCRPPGDSAFSRRVAAAFDRFVDLSDRTDLEVARAMRDLEIDIAVDLMGFTRGTRLGALAYRPAPVQVHYLGYPGTLGAPYIDYVIADDFVIPAGSRAHYAEHVVQLPETFQANDDQRVIGLTPSRAQVGLPEVGFVFCSFSNSVKLNPPVFDIWCRLLQALPGSVLWLLADHAFNRRNLQREVEARGISPGRLVFAHRLPYELHLGRLRLADLVLDTFPFNGGATASDALWAGVPVLTCAGEAFASRMAGSLLRAIGLPELVTESLDEYERLGRELAHSPARLQQIRNRLAKERSRSPLFDTGRFCRHLEQAYRVMHERARRGAPPVSFAVPALP